jgi:hypothetical protein
MLLSTASRRSFNPNTSLLQRTISTRFPFPFRRRWKACVDLNKGVKGGVWGRRWECEIRNGEKVERTSEYVPGRGWVQVDNGARDKEVNGLCREE